MLTGDAFRALALALPRAAKKPHFDRAAFFVDAPKGKIFATLLPDGRSANLMLDRGAQEFLIESAPDVFSRLPNAWGDKGATMIDLAATDSAAAQSALMLAWRAAAPEKLRTAIDAPKD
jgi:hypothetical protein